MLFHVGSHSLTSVTHWALTDSESLTADGESQFTGIGSQCMVQTNTNMNLLYPEGFPANPVIILVEKALSKVSVTNSVHGHVCVGCHASFLEKKVGSLKAEDQHCY